MCTLIALFGVTADVPLVVAANRDEFYARPWAPPAALADSPRIWGGRDLAKGGTWLGVTERGFFVGVTNQRSYGVADRTKRSRGQLVLGALATGSVDAARAMLLDVDAREYNPFNVLLGDAGALFVVYARGEARVTVEPLPPGIWVLNNDTIGSRDFPKANRARDLVAPVAHEPWSSLAGKLEAALGDHDLPPLSDIPAPPSDAPFSRDVLRTLQAICVHTPVYGTSSASLLALGEGTVIDYRFAGGPPCVTPFTSVTIPGAPPPL
jgi:uncharacterized protein with NRDE domain